MAETDPGYDTLRKANSLLAIGARPPPVEDVAEAFAAFFRYRDSVSLSIREDQAQIAIAAYSYLKEADPRHERFGLSNADIRCALTVAALIPPDEESSTRRQLATMLYEELDRRRLASLEAKEEEEVDLSDGRGSIVARNLNPYVKALTLSGRAAEARALLERYFDSDLKQFNYRPWLPVIYSFVRQEQGDEVIRTLSIMKSFSIAFSPDIHEIITTYYARKGDLETTKRWYNTPLDNGVPTLATDRAVLELCIREHDYQWGDSVFRAIFEKEVFPRKAWNIVFRWSAAKGKGVDEIERMMEVMIRKNADLPDRYHVVPDMSMINDLIELAMSKNDPYTAERYVVLGQKWKLEPDARTCLLQLEYRLKVGDLDGARAAYTSLRTKDTSDDQDVPLINSLVVALYEKGESYNPIMSIIEDLSERRVTLETPTIAALCQLHLRRGELDQINGLLSTHMHNCSTSQCEIIRDVFVNFILDHKSSDVQAWDAYTILSPTFPDTPISIRTRLMSGFFSRGRIDMGTHLFGHMRQQIKPSLRPTAATYAECFQGMARAGGDVELLHLVHNMLKVDTEIEPNTRLHNGLMLAYTACGNPGRALKLWDDIAHSREGPTYNSIQIALQACEAAPFGERHARDIWARLKRLGIQVPREIYAAYVGALGGQGEFKECIGLIEGAEAEAGFKPDALMIGTFYNTAPGQYNKEQVEAWAKDRYPDIWKELLAIGKTVVYEGDALEDAGLEGELDDEDLTFNRVGVFNIDRSVDA